MDPVKCDLTPRFDAALDSVEDSSFSPLARAGCLPDTYGQREAEIPATQMSPASMFESPPPIENANEAELLENDTANAALIADGTGIPDAPNFARKDQRELRKSKAKPKGKSELPADAEAEDEDDEPFGPAPEAAGRGRGSNGRGKTSSTKTSVMRKPAAAVPTSLAAQGTSGPVKGGKKPSKMPKSSVVDGGEIAEHAVEPSKRKSSVADGGEIPERAVEPSKKRKSPVVDGGQIAERAVEPSKKRKSSVEKPVPVDGEKRKRCAKGSKRDPAVEKDAFKEILKKVDLADLKKRSLDPVLESEKNHEANETPIPNELKPSLKQCPGSIFASVAVH